MYLPPKAKSHQWVLELVGERFPGLGQHGLERPLADTRGQGLASRSRVLRGQDPAALAAFLQREGLDFDRIRFVIADDASFSGWQLASYTRVIEEFVIGRLGAHGVKVEGAPRIDYVVLGGQRDLAVLVGADRHFVGREEDRHRRRRVRLVSGSNGASSQQRTCVVVWHHLETFERADCLPAACRQFRHCWVVPAPATTLAGVALVAWRTTIAAQRGQVGVVAGTGPGGRAWHVDC